uniref:NADH dehydrogenase subunit 2 n=1 Tax=Pedionis papillata TaxID=3035250 RepID=UPI0024116EAE|nr:NADH dehydrogenase subunit 2 [Pedionis papillata]WEP24745.1 NADH dehydrogenase subunit 2 [Pedionis papillata]
MNFNLTNILFLNTMMIGVMVSLSSNNWVNMWTGMEIGVLSVIPMMTQEKISSDSPMKYFIIQSVSSSMMIMSLMTMSMEMNFKLMMIISMLIKIGASPFHIWVLSLIEGMNFYIMFFMFTLIKIPGLLTISMLNEQMQIWSMLSMLTGALMAINQCSIKKILAYSSIYNLGVMLSSMNSNEIWLNYMLIYSLTLVMLMPLLLKTKSMYLNQLILNEIEPVTKISIWISFMSMAGLPPLLGFSVKMMIIEKLVMKKELMLMLVMISTSMIIMFLYMRISLNSMMMQSILNKWNMFSNSNTPMKIMLINFFLFPVGLTLKSLN